MFISTARSQAWPLPSVQIKWVVSIRTVSISRAPILSIVLASDSLRADGIIPGVTVIPESSVILWVRTVSFSLLYVPADVLKTRWNVYSVSTANPLILVLVISEGRGMLPALLPLRYKLRLRNSAVASSMGSHSRTTDVCVALRQRRTGGEGERSPKVW